LGCTEPVFVNLLRSPGIDSQHGGPVQQPYLSYWPARQLRLAESIPELLKRLQIWAQESVREVGESLFFSSKILFIDIYSKNNNTILILSVILVRCPYLAEKMTVYTLFARYRARIFKRLWSPGIESKE
jgi:hypothetical protein